MYGTRLGKRKSRECMRCTKEQAGFGFPCVICKEPLRRRERKGTKKIQKKMAVPVWDIHEKNEGQKSQAKATHTNDNKPKKKRSEKRSSGSRAEQSNK